MVFVCVHAGVRGVTEIERESQERDAVRDAVQSAIKNHASTRTLRSTMIAHKN